MTNPVIPSRRSSGNLSNRPSLHRLVVLLIAGTIVGAPATATASSAANPLFSKTHMLPSPFTLPAGRLAYGTEFDLGVTDFLQVGTDVLRDVFQFYNVNAKVSLFDWNSFASALTLGAETYNYRNIDSSNPDLRVTTYQPGAVFAFKILDPLALFVGGNYIISKATLITENITKSGYIHGAVLESDLAWAYNESSGSGDSDDAEVSATAPKKGKKPHRAASSRIGNALAVGTSYDVTYKLWGVGLSHHWPGFKLGFHYYPSATRYPVVPVIAGGGVLDF